MIIGSGLLANSFRNFIHKEDALIIFASGVSNSLESKICEFDRESVLLDKYLNLGIPLVYFSTCNLYNVKAKLTPYCTHKLALEDRVLSSSQNYVFRLPQVVGEKGNQATIANFIYRHVRNGQYFNAHQKAIRNFIDVDDCSAIVLEILRDKQLHPGLYAVKNKYDTKIMDVISIFETILARKANYHSLDLGDGYTFKSEISNCISERLGIVFNEKYCENVFRKYF
jgi:nucleoside-diphosphate-sugar epimerase